MEKEILENLKDKARLVAVNDFWKYLCNEYAEKLKRIQTNCSSPDLLRNNQGGFAEYAEVAYKSGRLHGKKEEIESLLNVIDRFLRSGEI